MLVRKMIRKIVKKCRLSEPDSGKDDLRYWLGKSVEERISAVEILRRQQYGSSKRLQRVVRIIKRKQG